MPRGGARPGAGRKTTRERYARPIVAAEKQIVDHLPQVIDSLLELARGVTVQEIDPLTGAPHVYTKPPDFRAGSYLVDRILGKPMQAVEASGPDGGPLKIVVEYEDPASDSHGDAASPPSGTAAGDP